MAIGFNWLRSHPKTLAALGTGVVGALYGIVKFVKMYTGYSTKQRIDFWRNLANARRFSPIVVLNTVRWLCSPRGLKYLVHSWGLVNVRARLAQAHPLPLPAARESEPSQLDARGSDRPGWVGRMISVPLEAVNEAEASGQGWTDPELRGGLGASAWAGVPDPSSDSEQTKVLLRVAPSAALSRKGSRIGPELLRRLRPYDAEHKERTTAVLVATDAYFDDTLWTEMPGSGIMVPYTVRAEWVGAIAGLLDGDVSGAQLAEQEPELYAALRRRWVLATPHEVVAQEEVWNSVVSAAAAHVAQHGWVVLEGLLPPEVFRAVRDHCRALWHDGASLYVADNGFSKYRWSEPVATFFNNQTAGLVSRIARDTLLPVRPITHWYVPGSGLPFHLDGIPYTYSMSLNVDDAYDASAVPPFAFTVVTGSITQPVVDIEVPLGSAVLFCGSLHPHYRDIHYSQKATSMSFSYDRLAY